MFQYIAYEIFDLKKVYNINDKCTICNLQL